MYAPFQISKFSPTFGNSKTRKPSCMTPGLARDRVFTWGLIMNFDSSAAIEFLTCAATWQKR